MFAIQLSLLLRSNSRLKCDSFIGSQTVRSPPIHPPSSHPLNAIPRSCTLCRKTLRIKPATTQIMPTIPLKIPATSTNWTSNYACFEKEIQTRLDVRRTGYVTLFASSFYSLPFFSFFFAFPARVFFRCLRFLVDPSDAQPSSMVSFAGADSLRVQRRKSVAHALPTRLPRWTNRCKAPSPSPTTFNPSMNMAQPLVLRQSNMAKSISRQDHCPRLPSPQIKDSLTSLRTPRPPPATLS